MSQFKKVNLHMSADSKCTNFPQKAGFLEDAQTQDYKSGFLLGQVLQKSSNKDACKKLIRFQE